MKSKRLQIDPQQAYLRLFMVLKLAAIKNCLSCHRKTTWYMSNDRPVVACGLCGFQISLLANTFAHNTKTPLHNWFSAAEFIILTKGKIPALALADTLDTGYQTAWRIKQVLLQTIGTRINDPEAAWAAILGSISYSYNTCTKCGYAAPDFAYPMNIKSRPRVILRCKNCNTWLSFTTGNALHKLTTPTSKIMGAISLLIETDGQVSIREFERALGLSHVGAFQMKKKLLAIIDP